MLKTLIAISVLQVREAFTYPFSPTQRSSICSLCRSVEERVISSMRRHRRSIEVAMLTLCLRSDPPKICDYVVRYKGTRAVSNKLSHIESTDYLCSIAVRVCPPRFAKFDPLKYEEWLYRTFPIPERPASKEKSPNLRIGVVSDIHLQPNYMAGAYTKCEDHIGCCKKEDGVSPIESEAAGTWGSPYAPCDAPPKLFDLLVTQLAGMRAGFDVVLLLGDYSAHDFFSFPPEYSVDATKYVIDALIGNLTTCQHLNSSTAQPSSALSNDTVCEGSVPVVPMMGNAETFPHDYFNYDDPESFVHSKLYPLLSGSLSEAELKDLSSLGFFSRQFPSHKIWLICLNTQIFHYRNEHLTLNGTDPLGILSSLPSRLSLIESKGERAIISGHMPPDGEESLPLKSIIKRFNSTVISVFTGHEHVDALRPIREKEEIIGVVFRHPPITPLGAKNPSFRIYQVNHNGELDYVQYSLDIDRANRGGVASFEKVYSFREEYKLNDASTAHHQPTQASTSALSSLFSFLSSLPSSSAPLLRSPLYSAEEGASTLEGRLNTSTPAGPPDYKDLFSRLADPSSEALSVYSSHYHTDGVPMPPAKRKRLICDLLWLRQDREKCTRELGVSMPEELYRKVFENEWLSPVDHQ